MDVLILIIKMLDRLDDLQKLFENEGVDYKAPIIDEEKN